MKSYEHFKKAMIAAGIHTPREAMLSAGIGLYENREYQEKGGAKISTYICIHVFLFIFYFAIGVRVNTR